MQLFYIPDVSGTEILLDENESKHAIRVLRLGRGSIINVTDGNGKIFAAEIADPNPKKCRLKHVEKISELSKRSHKVHIAIAPPKNTDRLEFFIEKATELGIDEISLIICENSERRIVKTERLEKILVSAMKQSMNLFLPKLNSLISFNEFVEGKDWTGKFIAHCHGNLKPHLIHEVNKGGKTVVLIGPEGDFSLEEVKLAHTNGFREISLGDTRLRTETAGIAACHIVNLANSLSNLSVKV